ncbi:glycerate kinase [Evansella tamaricis]|uniref:Glycerate kinase n=1 Tax=Evansella tamaricis TaxID=2069301 RepID=A0ABS6JFR9_9BACI|nr:glycerate kinase [Evansella tamaricis]MBU9711173.1 glycerate kinase [Evansella tamaricis]
MKVVLAPDSFKGALSAKDICASLEQGIKHSIPHAIVQSIPMADGGEGTVENMVEATNGRIIVKEVMGPLKNKVNASYGIVDNKTVIIEVAEASGLTLISEEQRNPMITTSYGTGELIKDALDKGFRRFIIGLGGSATNDAGVGILKALGMKFYSEKMLPLADGGGSLGDLKYIDDTNLDPRIKDATFMVACDVDNPFCGDNGASVIFGPQKGATCGMVEKLDQNLNHFAEVILNHTGEEVRSIKGGGAAGGIGAIFVTFFNATLQSGIELVMKEVKFEEKIANASLIITGEGKLDRQTLSGKVIMGVTTAARKKNVPVIALCGQLDLSREEINKLGLLAAFSIIQRPCDLKEAFQHTSPWLTEMMANVMNIFPYSARKEE